MSVNLHMDIYLVGGAVRDQLLNLPVSERDWVVVGANAEALLRLGYQQVGKDFPVFLHPVTQEEYALARKERKVAPGYGGFNFDTGTSVTLEEDLLRRDLTINAMAQDSHGNIIDPHQGRADLDARILRHVSAAFAEDPVRVLRLARFAARYYHLGFGVAEETMALMRQMVDAGEIDHLVPERVWKECSRALDELHPEIFFTTLRACGALARIMPELDALFGTTKHCEPFPAVDAGSHALMALAQACQLSGEPSVRFATLVRDLDKTLSSAVELAHPAVGKHALNGFCRRLAVPNELREFALVVAECYAQCHCAKTLSPPELLLLLNKLDAFRRPEKLALFCLCAQADARAYPGFATHEYLQADFLLQALAVCKPVDVQALMAQGFSGQRLGEAIITTRLELLTQYIAKTGTK